LLKIQYQYSFTGPANMLTMLPISFCPTAAAPAAGSGAQATQAVLMGKPCYKGGSPVSI
jgi:hypothetical protein